MADLRIKGDVSGYVDLVAPDVAGSSTIDLSKVVTSTGSATTLDIDNVVTSNTATTFTEDVIFEGGDNGVDIRIGTDKRIAFQGGIGEIGNVAGFQAMNTAGSANVAMGMRATDIRFATGSAERMRVSDNGVGIGNGIDATVGLELNGTGNTSRIKLIDGSAQLNLGLWDGSNYRIEGDANRKILLTSYHSDGVHIGGSGASDLVVKDSKVGIGTSTPANKLEVDGGAGETRLRVSTTGTDRREAGIILANSSKSAFNDGSIIAHGGGYLDFMDLNNTVVATMNMSDGKVGINTSSPARHLHIDGAIRLDSDQTFQNSGTGFGGGIVKQTPAYTEYQYTWGGNSDHDTYLYCASYFMADVTYTSHQTNGGSDIHRFIKGKWANNHTTHTWTPYHDSGNTWSIGLSISATDHNGGSGSANGRLHIDENYGSGSYSHSTLTIRCYYGTPSNITHT